MPSSSKSSVSVAALVGAAVLTGAAGFGLAYVLVGKDTPKAEATAAAPAAAKTEVEVSAGALAQSNIAVDSPVSGSLAGEINAAGTVVSQPGGEAVVVARAAGVISNLQVRLGDAVAAGQTIAMVDSLDAASIASDRSVAQTRAAQAQAVLARERKLFDQGVTARQDFEAAKAAADVAQAELQRANSVAQTARVSGNGKSIAIVSPIAGRVTAQTAVLGAYVTPDAELFRVANSLGVQIEAAIPAADARTVKVGDQVSVTAGDTSFTGTVRSVTPTASTSTGAATVLITPAQGASVVAGMGVQVKIDSSGDASSGLIVPEEAIQVIDGKDSVFVRTPKGFKAQPVAIARRTGGRAEITSGLQPGQQIATRNAFLLKAELNKATED